MNNMLKCIEKLNEWCEIYIYPLSSSVIVALGSESRELQRIPRKEILNEYTYISHHSLSFSLQFDILATRENLTTCLEEEFWATMPL